MKFSKNWKRFWTLDRHHAEGFTLVELIVVIAILAILAGVAVPAYSGYVTSANKQADATLVGEVAHALQLHYYSDPTNVTGGYVVLKSGDAAVAEADASGADAMVKVFGENWKNTTGLKYGEWTDDGLLDYVLDNADSAQTVANSTYLTTATPQGMMKAVTNLTDSATKVIQNYASEGGNVAEKLASIVGDEFVTALNKTGVSSDDDEYETVVSNMLVGYFADLMHGSSTAEVMGDQLAGMAVMYSSLYAYSETIGDMSAMEKIDAYLALSDDMDKLNAGELAAFVNNNTEISDSFKTGFAAYNGDGSEGTKGYADVSAVLEMMGAVDLVAGTYTDAKSLSNPNLYASDSVAAQLDNYISAVKAVATMDQATINALKTVEDGSVVVFLAADGSVSAIPGAAYLAS